MAGNFSSRSTQKKISADLLPPEIWLRVLRWATFVPNALDTDAPTNPLSYPPPLNQTDTQAGVRRSLRTKRALVLVCREWKQLSTRFLYEAVYVGLTTTIWKLYGGMFMGKEREKRIPREAFSWTKRLDFAIRDTSKKNFSENPEFLESALTLHVFMPNLEIFVARKTDTQTVLMQRLFTNVALGSYRNKLTVFDSTHRLLDCSESDERMVWTPVPSPRYDFKNWETSPSDDSNHWSIALCYFTSVRHLVVQPNIIPSSFASKIRQLTNPVRTPSLQYLVVTDWFPYRVNVENPDAQDLPFHLAYWGSLTASTSSLAFEDYLTHSPGLSTRLTTFECGRTHDMDIPELLKIVDKHCPNLQNIILTVPTWMSLVYALPITKLPRTVRRLGVRSFRDVARRSVMKDLCDRLCRVSEKSTSLRVVRFMGRQASRNLREVNLAIALQMKERMLSRGVSLEGSDGRPLLQ